MHTVVDSMAAGSPSFRKRQPETAEFRQHSERLPEARRARLPSLYEQSAID